MRIPDFAFLSSEAVALFVVCGFEEVVFNGDARVWIGCERVQDVSVGAGSGHALVGVLAEADGIQHVREIELHLLVILRAQCGFWGEQNEFARLYAAVEERFPDVALECFDVRLGCLLLLFLP